METNVIMHSKDRELFGIVIKQETKTGFLSLTELQKAYELARWQYGWNEKNISMLLQTDSTLERLYHVLNERNMIKLTFLRFTEMVKQEGVTKVLKGLEVYKTTGRGSNKNVMCDPYVWVLIALELNPLIYAKVMIFITDSLLFDRMEAGDEFKPMNSAIKSIIPNPEYRNFAIAINEKVFGKHQTGMRNLASSKELKHITKIEQFIRQGIELKMLKTEEEIINVIKNFNF